MYRCIVLAAGLLAASAVSASAVDAVTGDPVKGQQAALVCRACHQFGPDAKNAVGPVLNGVVGRPAGTYPGYNYSTANKTSGIVWTVPELQKYLANPQKVVKGTKMIFPGFPGDPQKVNNIIAFLNQYGPDGQKKTP